MHVYRLPSQFFPLISEEKAVRKAEEVVKGKFTDLQKRHKEITGVPYTLVRAANKSIAERIVLHELGSDAGTLEEVFLELTEGASTPS